MDNKIISDYFVVLYRRVLLLIYNPDLRSLCHDIYCVETGLSNQLKDFVQFKICL